MNIIKSFFQAGCSVVIAFLSFCFAVNAQEETIVKTATFNGEQVHVYPYFAPTGMHNSYFDMGKKIGRRQEMLSEKFYYLEVYGEEEGMAMWKEMRKVYRRERREEKSMDYFEPSKRLKQAVRKNPAPMLEPHYSLDQDVIPCLDPLPDGKYIQYFETFYLIDQKGNYNDEDKVVAGIFTLKNNQLEGEAIWLNMQGDTLKKGRFENGQKVGIWMLEEHTLSSSWNELNVQKYIDRGFPDMDTTLEYVNYQRGVKNGKYSLYNRAIYPTLEGTYTDNEATGTWISRSVGYIGKGLLKTRNRNNELITSQYTFSSSDLIVRRPIIRRFLIMGYTSIELDYDFDSKFVVNDDFASIYRMGNADEEQLDLEEEEYTSYEGEVYDEDYYGEYGEGGYYGEEGYYGGEDAVYDSKSESYVSGPKYRDSVGIIFNYEGVYENKYPNGQLMFRYEFVNGKLVAEDTVFWDNGIAHDIIRFDADSNQHVRSVYDYKGKLYREEVYDQLGEFVRVAFQPETTKILQVDGLSVEDREGSKYLFYDKMDSIQYMTTPSILFRSYFRDDQSKLYNRSYNPQERTLQFNLYAVTGKPTLASELTFSENFESWTGTTHYRTGNLDLVTTQSASIREDIEKDTIPVRNVNGYENIFNVTEDYTMYTFNENGSTPLTGNVDITFNEKTFKVSTKDGLTLVLPGNFQMIKKIRKDILRYRMGKKVRNFDLINTIDASEWDEDFANVIYTNLMDGFLSDFVNYPFQGGNNEYGEMGQDYNPQGGKNASPYNKRIKGQMLNGKPAGTWYVYDQKGRIAWVIPFENGLVNGLVVQNEMIYPMSAEEREMSMYEGGYTEGAFPEKAMHYLSYSTEYKNGLKNGKFISYRWDGKILQETSFKDGYMHGPAFERNDLAYTTMNYEDGGLDGYVKTYLTLEGQDSILLYNLNFQGGYLNGESKSFHINGSLAKRGFFLTGEAIEDYEAYDTLGFRYHYVKFLYGYPVEEKIWEENQLSVRYQFDWRDSIYFEPYDITTSQSLDAVIAELGLAGDYIDEPYMGRPSLIEKTGISYHMTKYYPNDTIARDGGLSSGKKVGCWKFYSYEGEMLYEVDYFDTVIVLNDSVKFKAKGILTDYNAAGKKLSESYIIEKFEKYDCSHTDHYEIRQLMTIWEAHDSIHRMNGYVKNYYDNGVLQNEGMMKNGLPDGVWKFYDPFGKLNQVGVYVLGKRDGRWLGGDLSKTKYLGDICLNPNMPDLEEQISYREKLLDIVITNYRMGKALNKEFYDVNLNDYEEAEFEFEGEIIEEK
jgi:antitoxin component YwqK of YwqJK toxin-antitoxin module